MDAYEQFVDFYRQAFSSKLVMPSGNCVRNPQASEGETVMMFSPHPDDEVIIGGLARRFQREGGCRIVNVGVSVGSNEERKDARRGELMRACEFLGWELEVAGWNGVHSKTRSENEAVWQDMVGRVVEMLECYSPQVIFCPHGNDRHPVHIGTYWLVKDALKLWKGASQVTLFLTEFWNSMEAPNLLVEQSQEDVGDLVAALSCHEGEVERNPYHLRLPAWMMDNVRRGAELIGGAGANAPDFLFGTLYKACEVQEGKLVAISLENGVCKVGDDVVRLFQKAA